MWLSCSDGWHFRPDASLLGIAMRRGAVSAWHAGSRFIYAAVLAGTLVLILAGLIDGVLGNTPVAAALIGIYAASCLVGFAPRTRITGEGGQVALTQGRRFTCVPLAAIRRARIVSAEAFHGTERKHLHLEMFGGSIGTSVLILDVAPARVIAVALPERELRCAATAIEQRLSVATVHDAVPKLIVHEC